MNLRDLSGYGKSTKVYHAPIEGGNQAFEAACGIKEQFEKGSPPWFFYPLPYTKLMLALTVSGAPVSSWSKGIGYVSVSYKGLHCRHEAPWVEIVKHVMGQVKEVFLPALNPFWLQPLGIDQAMYLAYINRVWVNILPEHLTPWGTMAQRAAIIGGLRNKQLAANATVDLVVESAVRKVAAVAQRRIVSV